MLNADGFRETPASPRRRADGYPRSEFISGVVGHRPVGKPTVTHDLNYIPEPPGFFFLNHDWF